MQLNCAGVISFYILQCWLCDHVSKSKTNNELSMWVCVLNSKIFLDVTAI